MRARIGSELKVHLTMMTNTMGKTLTRIASSEKARIVCHSTTKQTNAL